MIGLLASFKFQVSSFKLCRRRLEGARLSVEMSKAPA